MIAAMELGGTKTVVAIGESDGTLIEEYRFPTTKPEETFQTAIEWFAKRGVPTKIGIAAFGPVQINPKAANWGDILPTPKPHWSGFSITKSLLEAFPGVEITLETDVNAACLAEARIGAAAGLDNVVYITIGTGIGAGVLCDGRLLHGALHPEFGHLITPRKDGDDFAGACSFHGICLEGMASGPAIEQRWGIPGGQLPPEHAAWDTEAWYLAHGILSLLAIAPPERVVIGGGVSQAEGLHEKTEALVRKLAAGYFPAVENSPYVVPPKFEQEAGIRGALMLTGM
ncbi:MAG: ROK family protein [Akkermansiaceae bacterium]|jgi:fructokinase|nr:ROK family protein [Akkermansiaceae bacterium]MDP4647687.1 ROK family protein [Akkermansiaceae bacterium]MDP4722253.1 ROK family protein [Akkermansiaceae bacterium]MDP4780294.1 ROK family protein [Akkermansiaceae bacterium]MDP4846223.1 ROK family protein [Akkermansiaceae bacterium]